MWGIDTDSRLSTNDLTCLKGKAVCVMLLMRAAKLDNLALAVVRTVNPSRKADASSALEKPALVAKAARTVV